MNEDLTGMQQAAIRVLAENDRVLMPKVRNGVIWAKQNVILMAAKGLKTGVPLPPDMANYIADGLLHVYWKREGEIAFGIKRRRGEKDNRKANQREWSYAMFVALYTEKKQVPVFRAITDAARQFKVSPETIKKGWQKNRLEAKRQAQFEMQYLREVPGQPEDEWLRIAGVK